MQTIRHKVKHDCDAAFITQCWQKPPIQTTDKLWFKHIYFYKKFTEHSIYRISLNTAQVSNWTRVNLPIQIEKVQVFLSLDLNPGDCGPWN